METISTPMGVKPYSNGTDRRLAVAAAPPNLATLQNQLFNTLAGALGGNGNFQMMQPNAVIPPQATDDQVWQFFNDLPPASLTANINPSGGNQFYSDYTGVLSQLLSNALTNFQSVLGSYYPLWQHYLASLNPFPSLTQLPNTFYSWALANAPTVAGPGRSAYQAALLDPIFQAQTMALNTGSFLNNTPNFSQGVLQLFQQLPAGQPVSFSFDSASASSNVTSTWCHGSDTPFFGIFGSSDTTTSQLTQIFAASHITMNVSFQRVINFVAAPPGAPNGWYSSGALHQAYAATGGGAPWIASANPNWQTTFGSSGNMQYFVASLIVADGINVSVSSNAQYSASQQTQIQQYCSGGFWPFYWGSSSRTYSNSVSFNAQSGMTYSMASQVGNPLVIGAMVQPASQFLGGSAELAAFVVPRRR